MNVVVECLCSRKYSVDASAVKDFACENCKRTLQVPNEQVHAKIEALRKAWAEAGDNIKRRAAVIEEISALKHEQALPLVQVATQTGVREVVNAALVGACRFLGAGQELVFAWLKDGTLGVTRLISAFKEADYADGAGFLCDAIDSGKLKENQIAEAAGYLGESGTPRALSTLKALRRAYPGQAALLDAALAKLATVSGSATAVPEEAKAIPGRPSQQSPAAKKGCMGVLAALAALVLVVFALSGCDEVQRKEFHGLMGTVGYPGVAGARVEIYEASRFAGLDSTQGLITATTTDAGGRFEVSISEKFLSRPMIAVARPTTGATYFDYGAAGNPQVAFDGQRRPWVGMTRQWLGGEDAIAITPISTLAFERLMRIPSSEVGAGALRFDSHTIVNCNAGASLCFGLGSDAGEEVPAPPKGAPFPSQGVRDFENSKRCTAYTYVLLQLARAANAFVSATTAGTDSALDFYEALFDDAQDGVIDGRRFGVNLAFFTQAGAPAVLGPDIDGSSALLEWISTQPLSGADEAIAGGTQGGSFTPGVADMITGQSEATGAIGPARVDSFDLRNYPFAGNVDITLRGFGLRRVDVFTMRSANNSKAFFEIGRTNVGVDGEFEFVSASEMRIRLPNFALTTKSVHDDLKVASGADFRGITFELHSRRDPLNTKKETVIVVTTLAKVTNRTEILHMSTQVGRLTAAGNVESSSFGNNVYPASTDPATLVAGVDDVYALKIRVVNPGPNAINGVGLDLSSSTFLQNNNARVPDNFGGSAVGRAIIFENAAAFAARQLNLLPGDVGEFTYPFVFLDTAAPANLDLGIQVSFNCVLSGVSQGAGMPTVSTNDVSGFSFSVTLAPVIADNTAELAPLSTPTVPATVTAGASFTVAIDLDAVPRASAPMRDGQVEQVDLVITFNGATINLRLSDNFALTQLGQGLSATALIEQAGGGKAFPLVLSELTPSKTIVLTLQTSTGVTGALNVTATATLKDTATAARTTQTSGMATVTVTP